MTGEYDRRTFLRCAVAAGFVAPAIPILGCAREGVSEDQPVATGPPISRPVLQPWAPDAVHVAAPMTELPMAYVSRGLQRIFVDHDFRGRVQVVLAAHISVSSGLWRIPLLGDDLRVPISADDALREFEETDIGEWDPKVEPVEGDYRIRGGRPTSISVAFDCVPLAGTDGWVSAGPLEIAQCRGRGEEPCLEALMSVGTGRRSSARYCADRTEQVRLVTWACPDP